MLLIPSLHPHVGFHDHEHRLDDSNFNSVAVRPIVDTNPAEEEPLVTHEPHTPPLPVTALVDGISWIGIDDVSTATSDSHMSSESPDVVEGIEGAAVRVSRGQRDRTSCTLERATTRPFGASVSGEAARECGEL